MDEGEQREMCFLDSLLSESERYARILGERLKERVFDEIFPHFARGFIIHARQTGQIDANLESMGGEERNRLLEPYFSGTLTFLYRVLFLLYAESRDLLPVREVRGYYMKSLERIKQRSPSKRGRSRMKHQRRFGQAIMTSVRASMMSYRNCSKRWIRARQP